MQGQCKPAAATSPPLRLFAHFFYLLHLQVTCVLVTLTLGLIPTFAASHESTDFPPSAASGEENITNFTYSITNLMNDASNDSRAPPHNVTLVEAPNVDPPSEKVNSGGVHKTITSSGSDIPREFPTALVIASSIAAVCILVFFVVSYFWHTHQLDSRARKLAIRLAADSEHGARCQACTPRSQGGYRRAASESSQEQNNHYEVLTTEEERVDSGGGGAGSDGGRSSVGVSESEAGDSEDLFEPSLPPLVPAERGRSLVGGIGGGIVGMGGVLGGVGASTRGGRGAHRKWSRSRKSSGGASMEKRDSAVTDKEILTHFASRRHSTFFI